MPPPPPPPPPSVVGLLSPGLPPAGRSPMWSEGRLGESAAERRERRRGESAAEREPSPRTREGRLCALWEPGAHTLSPAAARAECVRSLGARCTRTQLLS